MTWLIDFITERPVMFARYVCYIVVAVAAVVGVVLRSRKTKKPNEDNGTMEVAQTSIKEENAMEIDKNKHSKIIRSLCKEILLPLGVFQKGNSRVYFDDNGYYLTMVEFQPSAWGRGSYLNVGVHFLWNTHDIFSFDAHKGVSSRVQNFSQYENDEQFEKEMRNMVIVAKEQILYFRNPDNVQEALYRRNNQLGQIHRTLLFAYHDRVDEARTEYSLLMNSPRFAEIVENWELPDNFDGLTQDFVIKRIKFRRKSLHEKNSTKKLPWNEYFDGEKT